MVFICTLETCGLEWSYWGYFPSLPANIAFCVLFAISMLLYVVQGIIKRRWLGFTIAMVCGTVLEVIGYIGRVLARNDVYNENPFLIQIVCLTIAPAFLAAGIYLCLKHIVITFGAESSHIQPKSYPRIFIPCDVLSLILQAGGGGYASVRTHQGLDPQIGNHIMIAGLSLQVVTLLIFIILAVDFGLRTHRRISKLGSEHALDPSHAQLRQSRPFKGFLLALAFSTLCIFTRCVYRVAELSEGWKGKLILTQKYFIGLEGAIIVAAVFALNFFHPGFCFKSEMLAHNEPKRERTWYGRRKGGVAAHEVVEHSHEAK